MKKIINNRLFHILLILILGIFIGRVIFQSNSTDFHTHIDGSDEVSEWTCSMHPQIRQNEPGKCPLCGMDLIPVTRQDRHSGQTSPYIYTMSPEAVALANVQTTRVSYTLPEHEVLLTGKIAVNEQKLAVITANYSGRIENLYVDYTGQEVTKGQKLVSIYSPALVIAQKELLEAAKYKETNPVLYNAAIEKLRLWKIPENRIKMIEDSGVVINEFDIYSDISGTVLRRSVTRGDYVSTGNVIFEIADLSNLWILFDAYESDILWLRKGQKVNFKIAAIPGREFESMVTFIEPIINPQTRTVSVRAEAGNPELILKPEMFVNAKISSDLNRTDQVLVVPRSAILWTGKRSVVYVKVPDSEYPAYEMREILLGTPAGGNYIVESGLVDGEEVVSNGVFAIDAAAQLRGNHSMMNRPESIRVEVPVQFKTEITELANRYFILKNALVESNFTATVNGAEEFIKSLNMVEMSLLIDDDQTKWMKKERSLRNYAELIVSAESIEDQRIHLSPLSNVIIEVAEIFGFIRENVYVSYCPMALDDEGAYWLSEVEDILNPYFGDAMLRCGEVIRIISQDYNHREKAPQAPIGIHHH